VASNDSSQTFLALLVQVLQHLIAFELAVFLTIGLQVQPVLVAHELEFVEATVDTAHHLTRRTLIKIHLQVLVQGKARQLAIVDPDDPKLVELRLEHFAG
jgi:hypothetical protein